MKVKLNQSEKNYFIILDINRKYNDDELLQITDKVYLEESYNVRKNERPANLYAKLGDKLQGMVPED